MSEKAQHPALRVGVASHRGKVREENQDRISRFRVPLGEVFLVVDGMGGHRDGARAAELVVRGFEEHLREEPQGAPPAEALQRVASRTNAELYRFSAQAESNRMGATLVLLLLRGWQAIVAHAGDSRAYLMRAGDLSRLTHDHTFVQQMLDLHVLSEEQARRHPDACVVTRAFGQEPEIELEVAPPCELRTGDRILLCSDGLCGHVEDAVIAQTLAGSIGAQEATERLIELALTAGGEDNVSLQVIRVGKRAADSARPQSRRTRRRRFQRERDHEREVSAMPGRKP